MRVCWFTFCFDFGLFQPFVGALRTRAVTSDSRSLIFFRFPQGPQVVYDHWPALLSTVPGDTERPTSLSRRVVPERPMHRTRQELPRTVPAGCLYTPENVEVRRGWDNAWDPPALHVLEDSFAQRTPPNIRITLIK